MTVIQANPKGERRRGLGWFIVIKPNFAPTFRKVMSGSFTFSNYLQQ